MATALSIINGALRLLMVKSSDVVLTADEASDGLEALNMMLGSWSNEQLMIYHETKESFTTTPNLNPHTIGAGGTFNTVRPITLDQATVVVGNADTPIYPLTYSAYADVMLKTLASTYPEYIYYEPDYPLGKIYLYPVPSVATSITLYSRKALTEFANLTDTVSLPVGYERALKFNLALELAPEYQASASNDVIDIARKSKKILKRVNQSIPTCQLEVVGGNGRFNIYRGQ